MRQLTSYLYFTVLLISANVSADEKSVLYPVEVAAQSAQELHDAIEAASLQGSFGLTTWADKLFDYKLIEVGDYCDIAATVYEQKITIYMPEWINKEQGKACLQDEFRRVWDLIHSHEEKHRDIFREMLTRIPMEVDRIELQPSCEVMADKAIKLKEAIQAEIQAKSDAIDPMDPPAVINDC